MKRKKAVYKGLQFFPVFFEDTSLSSPEYFQITEFPTKLTAGKNLFKLRGHPTNLKPGGALGIEVLDYNGDPIYHEVVDHIDDDKSRIIAIYIYEDTSPGDCTVTLVAEASVINGANAPIEQQGKINIRWTRSVPVNPSIDNMSEIIFEKLPDITITEQVGVQLNRTYPNSNQFPQYSTGQINYFSRNNQPVINIVNGEFLTEMKGGTVTVNSPTNPTPTPTYTIPTTKFSSKIKKILNTGSALLENDYTVFSSQSLSSHTFNEFSNSTFTIDYEATPIYTATENSQSFAYIQVAKLQPGTGDVSRIKVYTNNNGTVGTYDLVNDVELEETEIFIESTSSLFPDETIGLFTSQSLIDFWEAHTYLGNTETTAPLLIFNTSSLAGGATITSSINISNANEVYTFQVKDQYSGVFIEDSSYKLSFDAIGSVGNNAPLNKPTLSVYISGSAFDFDTTNFLNQELPVNIGKKIGEIVVDNNIQRYDDQIFDFETDHTGNGVLIFVVESGDWQIADVHVTSDNEIGYTPNYTRIKTPIETTHKIGNQISFKIEYYNSEGVRSKQVSFINNLDWEGGNRYIDGDYSLMTGSLYVADSLSSGVAISGYPNSGFIRSLGYEGFDSGFPGFLLWSGSAMPGTSDNYQGVGLELYADTKNFFRYRTQPSELIVKTQKFFLGDEDSTFVSGSNGNLEISSSNFHLTPQGNITASSAVFIDDGGNTMFDTNARYIDGLNVGRVVFYDKTETSLDLANIIGTANEATASVFQTFILPGETTVLMSCTYEVNNTAASGNDVTSVRSRAFIQSASLGPSVSPNVYGAFNEAPQNIAGNINIITTTTGGGTELSGAVNLSYPNSVKIGDRGGMYVQIFVGVNIGASGSPTGTLKLKNFVFRTSRVLGSTTTPVAATPGPITFP